jgi:hypothetical protein
VVAASSPKGPWQMVAGAVAPVARRRVIAPKRRRR